MSLKTIASGLYKSTRIGITIAFVVPVVMLGIACAVSTGLPIDWSNLMLGGCVIFFLLMISNGLNNIVDTKIDAVATERGNKKSIMFHGTLSRRIVAGILVLSVFAFVFLTVQLSLNTGKPVITFALFGLLMSVGYNLPPLKLAYRPFPELTMLLPSTIVAVVAMQYILVSQITAIAVCMGAAFGLFSATWFLWQSMVDYDVDKEAGKNTTSVYMGPLSAGIVGILYPAAGIMLLALSSGHAGLPLYTPAILGVVCMATMGVMMMFNAPNSFKIWKGTMWATFVFGVLSAVVITLGGR